MNVALVDTIIELLGTDALCPDDILTLVHPHPGISLDRVLITLCENSALFHRRRGRWYLVSLDVRDRHMSTQSPLCRHDRPTLLPGLQPAMPDDRLGHRTGDGQHGDGWWDNPSMTVSMLVAVFWGDECCPDCSRCPICQQW